MGIGVADALLRGGVRAIEITMTVPNAVALIEQLVPRAARRGDLSAQERSSTSPPPKR